MKMSQGEKVYRLLLELFEAQHGRPMMDWEAALETEFFVWLGQHPEIEKVYVNPSLEEIYKDLTEAHKLFLKDKGRSEDIKLPLDGDYPDPLKKMKKGFNRFRVYTKLIALLTPFLGDALTHKFIMWLMIFVSRFTQPRVYRRKGNTWRACRVRR
jgi:hypothetical protein